MRKVKSFKYDVLMFVLSAVATAVSVFVVANLMFVTAKGPIGSFVSGSTVMIMIEIILNCVLVVVLGIWITRLLAVALGRVLLCNVLECNSSSYPGMAYILKNDGQAREVDLNNMRACGDIPVKHDHYTVCVGFTKAEMRAAECMVNSRHHGVCWEVPSSFVLPDGVTCLARTKIALKDILWALQEMQDDETVFFAYSCQYPARKSQLAHRSREGEVVIIDVDQRAPYL